MKFLDCRIAGGRSLVVLLLMTCGVGNFAGVANAQSYPDRPVRIIVPFPPGGTTDVMGRVIAAQISAMWNASVVVENKSGASGTIGTAEGVAAAPDGYTFVMGNTQTHGMNSGFYPKTAFDVSKDVTPIALLSRTTNVLAVSSKSPYQTAQQLIQAGRTTELNYASVGQGSTSHITGDFLAKTYGLKATHIPYRGASPAVQALVSGEVSFMTPTYGSVAALAEAGRVRILAVAAEQRDKRIPNVPTFAEAGLANPGLSTEWSLFGPANLPRAIVNKWSDALAKVSANPEYISTLEKGGFELYFKPNGEYEKIYPSEVRRLVTLVKQSGIQPE